MRHRKISIIILMLFFMLGIGSALFADINPDGSLSYAVAIKLPPGTKGVAPQLSLVYNSNAGSGLLGSGWQLGGVSAISRDLSAPVNYTAQDRYVGPGGRLAPVADSFHGANHYHYTYENFSRIERRGDAGNPASWLETRPDGTKYYYEAAQEVVGKYRRNAAWWLSKVEDVNGNYYTIEYTNSFGVLCPHKIVYTQGNGISVYRTIEFVYDETSRQDYSYNYAYYGAVSQRATLKEIIIKTGVTSFAGFELTGDLVRRYVLSYNYGMFDTKLTDVKEYGTDNASYITHSFGWTSESVASFSTVTEWATGITYDQWVDVDANFVKLADVSGDGRDDLISHNTKKIIVAESIGSGFTRIDERTSGIGNTDWRDEKGNYVKLADVNGDGKTDLISHDGDDVVVAISVGYSFNPLRKWGSGINHAAWELMDSANVKIADVNGDGRADLITHDGGDVVVALSTGNGFTVIESWNAGISHTVWTRNNGNYVKIGDVNGDGMADLITHDGDNVVVALSTGTSFTIIDTWGGSVSYESWTRQNATNLRVADVNGDGKADLVYCNSWQIMVALSTGLEFMSTTFGSVVDQETWEKDSGNFAKLADVNGDGKTDLILHDGSSVVVSLSNGRIFLPLQSWGSGINKGDWERIDARFVKLADVNGDGITDLVTHNNDNIVVSFSQAKRELINHITEPTGSELFVSYGSVRDEPQAIMIYESNYPIVANQRDRMLVKELKKTDGRGGAYITGYAYQNGKLYRGKPYESVSLGFQSITTYKKRADGVIYETIIERSIQDSPEMAGKLAQVSTYAGTSELVKLVNFSYNPGRYSIFGTWYSTLSRYDEYNYIGGISVQSSKELLFDDYGNTIRVVDSATNSHTLVTERDYNYDSARWIMNRMAHEYNKNESGVVLNAAAFSYDAKNLVATSRFFAEENRWITTSYVYDQVGNVTATIDPKGNRTLTSYDADYQAFPVRVANAKGQAATAAYNPQNGEKIGATDPNGYTVQFSYDVFLRPYATHADGLLIKEIHYNSIGDPTAQHTETTKYVYSSDKELTRENRVLVFVDGLQRDYKTIQEAGSFGGYNLQQVVDKSYDAYGMVASVSKPYYAENGAPLETRYYTRYLYDEKRRLIQTTLPDNSVVGIGYSIENGYKVHTTTSPKGMFRDHYDRKDNIVKIEEPGNRTLYYSYNELGKLLTATNTDARQTHVLYDSLGRKTSIVTPDRGTQTYEYDDNNNVVKETDSNGNIITFSYDQLNRVTAIDYPDGTPDVSYSYDDPALQNAIGRLTAVNDGVCQTTYSYDKQGNTSVKTKSIDGKTFIFRLKHLSDNKLESLVYPDATEITRDYDPTGNLKAVKWNNWPIVRYGRFKLDEGGMIESFDPVAYRISGYKNNSTDVKTNEIEMKISFNPATMNPTRVVTDQVSYDNRRNTLTDFMFTYTAGGQTERITDYNYGAANQQFSYDAAGRLQTAKGIYGTLHYSFSDNGNLTQKVDKTLSYSDVNHPYAVTSDGTNAYSYDANGNMVFRKGKTLKYDAKNRLVRIANGMTPEQLYYYDYTNNRIKKERVTDNITTYNIDSLYEVTSIAGQPDRHTKYFYGMKNELAAQFTVENGVLVSLNTPSVIDSYYATDSIAGLCMAGYRYLNYYSNKPGIYRHFLQGLLAVLLAAALGLFIYVSLSDKKASFSRKFSPVLVCVLIALCSLTGCDTTNVGDAVDGTPPWEDTVTTETTGGSGSANSNNGDVIIVDTGSAPGSGETIVLIDPATIGGGSGTTGGDTSGDDGGSGGSTGGSGSGGSYTSPDLAGIPTSGMYFMFPDNTGSMHLVTDSAGTIISRTFYKPYGEVAAKIEGDKDIYNYKYNQQKLDNETGLMYYKFRFYDAAIGSFISPDDRIPNPLSSKSFNRYAYVEGNPIDFMDRDGHRKSFLRGLVYGVVGAVMGAVAGAIYGGTIGAIIGGIGGIGGGPYGMAAGAMIGGGYGMIVGAIIGAVAGGTNGYISGYRDTYSHDFKGVCAFVSDSTWAIPVTVVSLLYMGYLEGSGAKYSSYYSTHSNAHIYSRATLPAPGLAIGNTVAAQDARGSEEYLNTVRHELTHTWQYRIGGLFAALKLLQEQICTEAGIYYAYNMRNNLEHQAVVSEDKKSTNRPWFLEGDEGDKFYNL